MKTMDAQLPVLMGDRAEVLKQVKQRAGYRLIAIPETSADDATLKSYIERGVACLPRLAKEKRQRATERWMKLYLEGIEETIEIPQQVLSEAHMLARSQARVLESGQFFPAAKIMKLAGSSAGNASATPNRWKKEGLIFAIQRENADLFPLYALDPEENYRPRRAMKEILGAFREKSPWRIAFWFESPNSYLRNKKPREVLADAPAAVIEAARTEAAGVLHA